MESDNGGKSMRGRGRGRGRGGRGRGVRGGRGGRGRGKKSNKVVECDEDEGIQPQNNQQPQTQQQQLSQSQQHQEIINEEGVDENQPPPKIDLEADILQLEAPTFTTINRGPPEPMLRLRWDHRVNLVAEKVLNPMIHCCDKCQKPILIYGRMIPCKHVFCLTCAKREDKVCPRCMNKVARVEQTGLGTVFMCTHDGSRYGNTGCRRTYLSQRDLQAHINHRHISAVPALGSGVGGDNSQDQQSPVLILSSSGSMGTNRLKPQPSTQHMTSANDPRIPQSLDHHRRNSPPTPAPPQYMPPPQHRPPHTPHQTHPASMYQPQPNLHSPATSTRTNLITVQIQDSTATGMDVTPTAPPSGYFSQPPPPHPAQYAPSPYPVPPPPPQFYQAGPPPPTAYPPVPPPPGPPLPPSRPPPSHTFQEVPHSHAYNPPPQWAPRHPANATQQFY